MYETPAAPAPVPLKKKRSVLLPVLIGVFAVLLMCVGGAVIVGVTTDNPEKATSAAPTSTPNAQQPVAAVTTAAAPTTPAAPPPPPPPPPPPSIEDGTWTVGVDIPAGSYRTTTNVGANCYWSIYKSGTNGSEIIENDIPGGGRPQVTLKAGQDFRTSRCGKWSKVG